MNHTDLVLLDLEEVTGGPLPTVLPLDGDYERPDPARVEPPKPVKHVVWVTTTRGVDVRFESMYLPHTAKHEALIEARGRFPGQVLAISVREIK